jgi:hypothetical protein
MKKLFLLFIAFTCVIAYSQDFPANNVDLLNGKQLKIKEKNESSRKYGFRGFYKDKSLDHNKVYGVKGYGSATDYDSLVGKVFKLISASPYKNSIGKERFILEIENPNTGIIYYDYNPTFEYEYPFEVIGGLKYPENFFCNEIEVSKDKFTGETRINSPMHGVYFVKTKKETETHIYLFLRTPGSTANVNIKGVIILLDNGMKIEKPDCKIDVEVGESNYLYSCLIELNNKDIQLLTANKMTDYRLYVYDNTIKNGNTLMEYLKCITKN